MIQKPRSEIVSSSQGRPPGQVTTVVLVVAMIGSGLASPSDSVVPVAAAASPADAGGADGRPIIEPVGVDTPSDPALPSPGAGVSPAQSSGPFDAARQDLGQDDDLALRARRRQRSSAADVDKLPDPLRGTPEIDPRRTGADAETMLRKMIPPRSDSWADWSAGTEPLHVCGEPRWLPPCVPPPPCHPSLPPRPYDLVGVRGEPTDGPIYRGPCNPRTGTHDDCPHPHARRLHDRLFDLFYMWK